MALGIGYMFGFKLPLNFNSPLKASSIMDFWRRWHMTMTRFFTNYLYSPVGVSMMRRSIKGAYGRWHRFALAAAFPVIFTFVLAGLWHGAGWTFVVFGLIHGLALAINHGWREARLFSLPYPAGWALTLLVVLVGLVFFRADSIPTALTMMSAMLGFGADVTAISIDALPAVGWIVLLSVVVLTCPNTQEIMRDYWFSSDPNQEVRTTWPAWLAWRPSPAWAIACAIVLFVSIGSISGDTTFIYYQF